MTVEDFDSAVQSASGPADIAVGRPKEDEATLPLPEQREVFRALVEALERYPAITQSNEPDAKPLRGVVFTSSKSDPVANATRNDMNGAPSGRRRSALGVASAAGWDRVMLLINDSVPPPIPSWQSFQQLSPASAGSWTGAMWHEVGHLLMYASGNDNAGWSMIERNRRASEVMESFGITRDEWVSLSPYAASMPVEGVAELSAMYHTPGYEDEWPGHEGEEESELRAKAGRMFRYLAGDDRDDQQRREADADSDRAAQGASGQEGPGKGPDPDEADEVAPPASPGTVSPIAKIVQEDDDWPITYRALDAQGNSVGFIKVARGGVDTFGDEHGLYISLIGVDSEYRRMGVATDLLNHVRRQNPDESIEHATTTPEGTKWREGLPEGWQDKIPPWNEYGELAPAPPASPGTTTTAPTLPDIPTFHTPDEANKKANIAAAKELLDLALKGDVAGLKAYKPHPKAKKVKAYRYQLLSALLGPKGGTTQPEPPTVPVTSTSVEDDPALEAEIDQITAELTDKFGMVIADMGPGPRVRSKGWLKILEAVRKENEALEARWPGITKGVKLTRRMPGPNANGVCQTSGDLSIQLRPNPGTDPSYKNQYGMPFGISGGDVGAVWRHELTHALDWMTKAKYRDALKQTNFEDEDGNPINTAKWAKRHVSEYAGTMTSESIAEMFALFTSPDYEAGRLPERIEAIMEALGSRTEPPPPEKDHIPGGHLV